MSKYSSKKVMGLGLIIGLFVFISLYAFFRSKNIIFGVKIRDVSIEQADSLLYITGNAKNAQKITLNGREISIDKEGDFKETIALLAGYNIIEIQANDKFGKIDQKDYQLMYTPPSPPIEEMEELDGQVKN